MLFFPVIIVAFISEFVESVLNHLCLVGVLMNLGYRKQKRFILNM